MRRGGRRGWSGPPIGGPTACRPRVAAKRCGKARGPRGMPRRPGTPRPARGTAGRPRPPACTPCTRLCVHGQCVCLLAARDRCCKSAEAALCRHFEAGSALVIGGRVDSWCLAGAWCVSARVQALARVRASGAPCLTVLAGWLDRNGAAPPLLTALEPPAPGWDVTASARGGVAGGKGPGLPQAAAVGPAAFRKR